MQGKDTGRAQRMVLLVATALIALCSVASVQAETASAGKPSLAGLYLAGRYAQRIEAGADAAKFMTQAVELDPSNPVLVRRAFLLHLGEGDLTAARAMSDRLATVQQDTHLSYTVRIADAVKAGRLDEAEATVKAMGHEGLSQYIAPLVGAWVHAAKGDVNAGLASLDGLMGVPGFEPVRALHAALISDMAGRNMLAKTWFDAVAPKEASLRVVQAAASFHSRNGQAADARALYDAYRQSNSDTLLTASALNVLERGEKLPPVVANAREGLAEALFTLSVALQQEDAPDMAMMYARIALELRPDHAMARLLAGDVLSLRGRHAEALAMYKAIKGDEGLEWTAGLKMADELAALDRKDEAVRHLQSLASRYSDRSEALIELGDLHRAAGEWAKALGAYDQALAKVQNIRDEHWSLLYARGVALERTGRWNEAERDLKQALELNPDQPYLLNFLGYAWVRQEKNLDEAIDLLTRAVALRPSEGAIADSLGWAYFRKGEIDTALSHLERAVVLKPLDAAINDHLGDAYWAAGRKTEAVFQWNRALQRTSEPELVAALRTKLDTKAALNRHQAAAN